MAISALKLVTGYYLDVGTPGIASAVNTQIAAGWTPVGAPQLTDTYGQCAQTMVMTTQPGVTAYSVVVSILPTPPDATWDPLDESVWVDTVTWLQAYTKGNQYLAGVVPVLNGGTGATTPSAARSNLGIGSIGTLNSVDLTANVTGILPIANGGTGADTPAGALAALGAVGRLVGVKTITVSGTYTKPAGVNSIIVEVMGGGGAGGGSGTTGAGQLSIGAGGASGSYAKHRITAPAASYPVLVGGGGAGAFGGGGGKGGDSSFGSVVTTQGGPGGTFINATSANAPVMGFAQAFVTPPTVVGGNLVVQELDPGKNGVAFGAAGGYSGIGGASPLGSPGVYQGANGAGAPATGYGAGGSGALSAGASGPGRSGGNGAPGVVIVWEFS